MPRDNWYLSSIRYPENRYNIALIVILYTRRIESMGGSYSIEISYMIESMGGSYSIESYSIEISYMIESMGGSYSIEISYMMKLLEMTRRAI